MFVKVCGITSEEDALLCVAMGADAVGFIFAPSPRQVAPGAVANITTRLPGEILTIGVFRDSLPERVIEVGTAAGLKGVQLHGNESPEDVAAIRPYFRFVIKAFPAGSPLVSSASKYEANALMIDSPNPGSGQVFDWRMLEGIPRTDQLILAGGLNVDNIAEAIHHVRPWGVDVNSGVESSPGHKDPRKVREFIAAVRYEEQLVESSDENLSGDESVLYDWQEEE